MALANAEMDKALDALGLYQEGAGFDCKAALAELIKQDEKKDGVR